MKRPTSASSSAAVAASAWADVAISCGGVARLLRWRRRPPGPRRRTARPRRRRRRSRSGRARPRRRSARRRRRCRSTRRGHLLDGGADRPRRRGGSARRWRRRPRCGGAPSSTAATARPVSTWISRDEVGDLAGGALGLLGELADLLGDDREAAALLAGAGGLDGGVERQQVGLLGDRGDRLDDPADLAASGRRSRPSRPRRAAEESRCGGCSRSPPRRCGRRRRRRGGRSRRPRWSATAMPALEPAARAASSTAVRVDSTSRTWRSAPCGDLGDRADDLADGAAGVLGGRRPSAARRRRPCRRWPRRCRSASASSPRIRL